MPVTVRPSSKVAEDWNTRSGSSREQFTHVYDADHLLSCTTSDDGEVDRLQLHTSRHGPSSSTKKASPLIQSSFADLEPRTNLFATKNGLVHTVIEAYNQHHNLVIRPDDVWLAILTQLSVYVNANSDELRDLFVEHSGQRELHIEMDLKGVDHGQVAFQMTRLMASAMRDPTLRDWVLPAFSTTEKTDEAVASIVFMGTMQKYFTYSWGTRCGIPSVTLLGEADDWIEIAARCADRLGSGGFGEGARTWYRVLEPVLDGFIETFRNPDGRAADKFWKGVCDKHKPNGSGAVTYSGWITALCYWDEKGNCLHMPSAPGGTELTRSQIPMGFAKVPVTLYENNVPIKTEMIAGSVGLRVRKSILEDGQQVPEDAEGRSPKSRWDGHNTLQPEVGWFMRRA